MEGVRVLVVDDNAVNRRVVHEQVVALGLRNGTAASGSEAMEILRHAHELGDPYQIVLLDDEMPEMDGESVAREIKADATLAAAVLVMLTSGDRWQERERLGDLGFSACLTRPVRQSQLMNALALAWSRATGGREPVALPSSGTAVKEAHTLRARVLVAEDNIVNQALAVRMLERLGCRVDVAADGLEVLQMVRLAPYDAVFMDCEMPEMDGYQATAALRSDASSRAIPVIALTAHAMVGERERCLAAGMDDYIAKPVRRADLERVLARLAPREAPAPGVPSPSNRDDRGPLTAPVDPLALSALREAARRTGGTVVHDLCDAFQRKARDCVQSLRRADEAGQRRLVRESTQVLRTAAERLGARFLAWLCLELEEMDEQAPAERSRTVIDLLECELARVGAQLRH